MKQLYTILALLLLAILLFGVWRKLERVGQRVRRLTRQVDVLLGYVFPEERHETQKS